MHNTPSPKVAGLSEKLKFGGVAQLGERCVRNAEVGSSILLLSTNSESKPKRQSMKRLVIRRFFVVRRPRPKGREHDVPHAAGPAGTEPAEGIAGPALS